MTTRHIVVAALLAFAGAAQADVVSTTGFQNGWTAGDGSSVIGSGVLGSDVSLVGGIAHNPNADLSSALIGKASASLSAADAQKLFVQQGIDASYVLSAGNGMIAARYGNSVSVINDGDGVKIMPGQGGGGNAVAPGAPGGGAGGAPGAGGPSAGGGNATAPGGGVPGVPGADNGGGSVIVPGPGTTPALELPVVDEIGALPDQIAAVPEPGTIALMLAGLVGAGAFSRRRQGKK